MMRTELRERGNARVPRNSTRGKVYVTGVDTRRGLAEERDELLTPERLEMPDEQEIKPPGGDATIGR